MSALITQLVTEEPTIVVIGMGLPIESRLWLELQRSSAQVHQISLHSSIQQTNKTLENLESAYKVVCCVKPSLLSEGEAQKLTALLSSYQAKTVLVLLIDTATQFSPRESESITRWRIASDAQEQVVRLLTSHLDRTRILFCQDVCQSDRVQFLPAWHALCLDSVELIDPQLPVSPCFVEQVCPVLAEKIMLPHPQPSALIRGSLVSTTTILQEVLTALSRVSMRTITIRQRTESIRPILPFSTQEIVISSQPNDLARLAGWLAAVVPSLPQPKPVSTLNKLPLSMPVQQQVQQSPTAVPELLSPILVKKQQKAISKQEIDVTAELQKIFIPERVTETVERVVKIAKTEKTTKVKGKRKRILFTGGIIAIVTGLLVLILVGIYTISVMTLRHSLEETVARASLFQTTSDESLDVDSQLPSPLLTKIVAFQAQLYGGLLESSTTAHAKQYVEIAQLLPSAVGEFKTTQDATIALYSFVMGNELGDVEQLSNRLTTAAQNSYEQLSKLQAVLKTVEVGEKDKGEAIQQSFTEALTKIRKTLVVQQQLHIILPQLLGEPTKRTYAVILQNSQELRPTGGFIQSVALLTFANGSLVSSEVLSSYELDQKLLGSVQPPEEIQRYLGEKQWFLRDSNWDPHFPNSASKIAWFIDQTRGVQIDGVMAFNLESMRSLLEVVGPLDVPEYNEVITNKNLLERMEFHSEVVLAPDSAQRDYSTVLLEKLLTKMTELPQSAVVPALSVLQTAIAEQEVFVALFSELEGELLANLGWSGGVVRPTCPGQLAQASCVVDYLYPVEANVGVNKANAYISRTVLHDVVLDATSAAHTHVLRLENTARSNSWPKGSYKNYQRFFLPEKAVVSVVKVNGQVVPGAQKNTYTQQGLTVLGLEISVPIQQQVEVVVEYSVPISPQEEFSYALFLQKQSGVREVPTVIRVHFPAGLEPVKIAPNATVTGDVVEFNLKQSEHAFVGVWFK